jgi:DNA-binding transcriptional ArsR family regulator
MFQQARRSAKPKLRGGQIADPRAIAALASPVRQEILDTIEALDGMATIAELAAQLGRPADGLYYHVAVLARAGLLVAAPERRSRAGRSERRFRVPVVRGRALRLVYRPRDARNTSAVRDVVGGMLRIARRDFDRALAHAAAAGAVTVDGPRRTLWAARGTGWVSDDELTQINALLTRIAALLRQPRDGDRQRLISLCHVLAPMTARPVRRTPGAPPARRKRAR